jgi:hypothetical protein
MANPVTFRMWVPNRHGRADLHLRSPQITTFSVVHISISEATALDTVELLPPRPGLGQTFTSVFGDAAITLQNVAVRQGAVDFRVFVDWDSPLDLVADITIFDPPAEVIIGE